MPTTKALKRLPANLEFHAKAKHIQFSVHFQREKVENGQAKLIHVATEEQAADGLTKLLGAVKFRKWIELLNLQ
jgi:predicted secreted protein